MMVFVGITDFYTYLVGLIFIVLLPGPNSLFVLTTAAKKGIVAGYRAAAGVFVGDALLMFAAALGAASLLKALPALFVTIKFIGALYLSWLGISLLKAAWQISRQNITSSLKLKPQEAIEQKEPIAPIATLERPFHQALVISLVNPKAILFFITFFIQFVDPTYAHPALSFLVLGLVAQTFSMIYLSILILGAIRLGQFFYRQTRLAIISNALVGLLFIGFAIRLAFSHL